MIEKDFYKLQDIFAELCSMSSRRYIDYHFDIME